MAQSLAVLAATSDGALKMPAPMTMPTMMKTASAVVRTRPGVEMCIGARSLRWGCNTRSTRLFVRTPAHCMLQWRSTDNSSGPKCTRCEKCAARDESTVPGILKTLPWKRRESGMSALRRLFELVVLMTVGAFALCAGHAESPAARDDALRRMAELLEQRYVDEA